MDKDLCRNFNKEKTESGEDSLPINQYLYFYYNV